MGVCLTPERGVLLMERCARDLEAGEGHHRFAPARLPVGSRM